MPHPVGKKSGAQVGKVDGQDSVVGRGQGELPLLDLPPLLVGQIANDLDRGIDNNGIHVQHLVSWILVIVLVLVLVDLTTSDD